MLSASSQPPMVTSWARPAVIIFQPMFNFWVIIGFFMPNAAQISLIRVRFCANLTVIGFAAKFLCIPHGCPTSSRFVLLHPSANTDTPPQRWPRNFGPSIQPSGATSDVVLIRTLTHPHPF